MATFAEQLQQLDKEEQQQQLLPKTDSMRSGGPAYDFARELAGQQPNLKGSMFISKDLAPDRAADILKLSTRTGLPPDLVKSNFDAIKAEAAKSDFDPDAFAKNNPIVAAWAAKNPYNAAVARDDYLRMGALEWMLQAPRESMARGMEDVELNRFAFREMKSAINPQLALSREERARFESLLREQQTRREVAGPLWQRMIAGTLQQLPQTGGALAQGQLMGAQGALATAGGVAIASAIVPAAEVVTVPAAALAGYLAGTFTGAAMWTQEQEAGGAWLEYRSFRDARGQPLDPKTAYVAAQAAGVLNAGLETAQLGFLLRSIPGAGKLFGAAGRDAVAYALRSPTVRSALGSLAVEFGVNLTGEVATEVGQRAVTIMSGELAKYAQGGFQPRAWGDIGQDLLREGVGALESFPLMLLPGHAMGLARDLQASRSAQIRSAYFQALGENIKESKAYQRLPSSIQEIAAQATEGGPIENVRILGDDWVRYWQSVGVDPAEVARRVMGTDQALSDALETEGDLVIPTSRYAAILAPTEHNAELSLDLKLEFDDMTMRQATYFQGQMRALSERVNQEQQQQDQAAGGTEARLNQLREQLLATGKFAPDVVDTYAQLLYSQPLQLLAARAGVDPAALVEQYAPTVRAAIAGEGPTTAPTGESYSQARDLRELRRKLYSIEDRVNQGWFGQEVDQRITNDKLLLNLQDNGKIAITWLPFQPQARAEALGEVLAFADENGLEVEFMDSAYAGAYSGITEMERLVSLGFAPYIARAGDNLMPNITIATRKPKGKTLYQRAAVVEVQPDYTGGVSPAESERTRAEAPGRLGRTLARDARVGAPLNKRTVLQSGENKLVVGRVTFDDWVERVSTLLSTEDLRQSRAWYRQLFSTLEPLYGEDAPVIGTAWLASQINESPSGGFRSVLRAMDLERGLPPVGYSRAGLAENAIRALLRGTTPQSGLGVKLLDFMDSELGFSTRTAMGRDVRGGGPAAIDIWAFRDIGFVDDKMRNRLIEIFGAKAVKKVSNDLKSIHEPQYEYGSRFYNDLARELNARGFNGGNWIPSEAQAVGWVSLQKALRIQPEFVSDIIGKNVRRVSLGLSPGEGAPQASFAGEQARQRIEEIAKLANVKIMQAEEGAGAYLGSVESAFQIDALASPEAADDFATALGYAFGQTEVWVTRALKSGKKHAFDVLGPQINSMQRATDLFERMYAYLSAEGLKPEKVISGFQQTTVNGVPGIRFVNSTGHWSKKALQSIQDAAVSAAEDLELGDIDAYGFPADLRTVENDWTKAKAGEGYTRSLRERGRDALAAELERRFAPTRVERTLEQRGVAPGDEQRAGGAGAAGYGRGGPGEVSGATPAGWSDQTGVNTPTFHARPPKAGAISVVGVHYGKAENLSSLSGSMFGTGTPGAERERIKVHGTPLATRVYFYAQKEDGVMPRAEGTVIGQHVYRVKLDNIYDAVADPDGIVKTWLEAGKPNAMNGLEHAIIESGYDGYFNRNFGQTGAVVTLGIPRVDAEYLGIRESAADKIKQENEQRYGLRQDETSAASARTKPLAFVNFLNTPAGRRFEVGLLEGANLTSFVHETGHIYLEMLGDLAALETADPTLKQDYDLILKWLGVESRAQIQTEHHEKFARGLEAYFMRGVSPSSALRQTFARIREWFKRVYRDLHALNVELSPEVTGVFDRIFATDTEIELARQEDSFIPLFIDAQTAGMSPEMFAAYKARLQAVSQDGRARLQAQMMRDIKRAQTDEYNARKEEVTREVEEETYADPTYRAISALRRGKSPQGDPLDVEVKLNRDDVERLYKGDPAYKTLDIMRRTRGMYLRESGMHPDVVAEQFGFTSGKEMLESIAQAEPMRDKIKRRVQERLNAEFGDMLSNDAARREEAIRSLYTDARADVVEMELDALQRLVRQAQPAIRVMQRQERAQVAEGRRMMRSIPGRADLRSMARGMVGQQTVRNLDPQSYLRMARKSSRESMEALMRRDFASAAAAKRTELLNMELYNAAFDAREQVEDVRRYMAKFQRRSVIERLGKAGHDYLDQIQALLGRFEFIRVPYKALDKREALGEWIKQKEASGETLGEEINLPARLVEETTRINYRQLTVDEINGIYDTVRQIEHIARVKNKLLASAAKREWLETEDALAASVREQFKNKAKLRAATEQGMSLWESLTHILKLLDASMLKPEIFFEFVDGGTAGPWHDTLWSPAVDAQTAEYDLTKEITAKITRAVQNIPSEVQKSALDKVVLRLTPGVNLVRRDLLGIALNVGNESNYDKLVRSNTLGVTWSKEQIDEALGLLTKEEWDFVQGVWDTLETMKPAIWKLQKELTGLEPEEVKARQVETKFGAYRGGYYPLMYDPRYSDRGGLQLASTVGGLVDNNYVRATTPQGRTKARVQQFTAAFDLTLNRLPSEVAGVIKDLTHRKVIMDANKVLRSGKIRQAITDTAGSEYLNLLEGWVRNIANDRSANNIRALFVWQQMLESARINVTIAALGFKASTMITQLAGLGPAIEATGARWMVTGYRRFISNPPAAYDFVTSMSGEMRHRFQTRDETLRDVLRSLSGKEDLLSQIRAASMYGIGLTEMLVSLPTWLGAYERARHEKKGKEQAIREGDRAVRKSQGAGGAKDLAMVAVRSNALMRIFTLFYTPFSALYGQLRSIGHDVGRVNPVRLFARTMWVWVVPALMAEILTGNVPDEDAEPEDWWRFISGVALYPLASIPIARDAFSAWTRGYSYQFSPIAQLYTATTSAVGSTKDMLQGDEDIDAFAKKILRAAGLWVGLPTSQLITTGDYLYQLSVGEEEPESIRDFIGGMLLGKK